VARILQEFKPDWMRKVQARLKTAGLPSAWINGLIDRGDFNVYEDTDLNSKEHDAVYTQTVGNLALASKFFAPRQGGALVPGATSDRKGLDPDLLSPSDFGVLVHELFHYWYDKKVWWTDWKMDWFDSTGTNEEEIGLFIQNIVTAADTGSLTGSTYPGIFSQVSDPNNLVTLQQLWGDFTTAIPGGSPVIPVIPKAPVPPPSVMPGGAMPVPGASTAAVPSSGAVNAPAGPEPARLTTPSASGSGKAAQAVPAEHQEIAPAGPGRPSGGGTPTPTPPAPSPPGDPLPYVDPKLGGTSPEPVTLPKHSIVEDLTSDSLQPGNAPAVEDTSLVGRYVGLFNELAGWVKAALALALVLLLSGVAFFVVTHGTSAPSALRWELPPPGAVITMDPQTCDMTLHYVWRIVGDASQLEGKTATATAIGPGLQHTYATTVKGGQMEFNATSPGSAWSSGPTNGCQVAGGGSVTWEMTLTTVGSLHATPNGPTDLARGALR
jgi:hypothetical protein